MRCWLAGLALGLAWLGGAGDALAQGAATPPTAQQERMRTCNAEAGTRSLAGDARRSFMSECLARRAPAAAPATAATPQQERMRTCNAEAGTRSLAGEARRTFMSECLSRRTGNVAPASTAATYRTEPEARTACGDDLVVWGNSDSKIFHPSGSRLYGNTQAGAYLCRSAAELAGYRAAR